MRLLLDTHVWLRVLRTPLKLSRSARRAIEDVRNETWISPVSAMEFLSICRRHEFRSIHDPSNWIRRVAKGPFKEAPLTFDVAVECGFINLPHGDPADRLIVATARVLGLTLVTGDENIIESGLVATIDNR